MLDLAVPSDTLGLFNFSQYVKKNGKETFPFIFFDNFDMLYNLFHSGNMRSITYEHIQKTILCSSIHLGYDLFECPSCGKETIIAHTCSSCFCTKCGTKASKQRAAYVSTMAFETKHRHIVFTIPKELRPYFIHDRSLLDGFFIAASNTLKCVFNDSKYRKDKKKNTNTYGKHKRLKSKYLYKDKEDVIIPGAIASLHTFGRSLDWNPHIHVLICEDGYHKKKHSIKNFSYMSYEKLRQTWRFQILEYLDQRIGGDEQFQRLKLWFYAKYTKGFYVHAPKPKETQDLNDIEKCVQYITRYTSRPIMAESRIVEYNPDTKMVHWYYHRHEDDKRIDVKEHVHHFIKKVILHCPEKHFKMVRYFGFYSNKGTSNYNKMAELLGKRQRRVLMDKQQRRAIIKTKKEKTHFRYSMIQSFQRDPLLCSCGDIMTYVESYDPLEGGRKNDQQYRDRCIFKNKYLKKNITST